MTLGNFTRVQAEARTANLLSRLVGDLNEVVTWQRRLAAENAAGTFDGAEFYQGDPEDKARLLGAMDDALAAAKFYYGQLTAAEDGTVDRRRYADFLLGLGG